MSQSSYSLGQYVSACEYNFQFRYCPQDMNKKNKGICLELCTIYLSLMLILTYLSPIFHDFLIPANRNLAIVFSFLLCRIADPSDSHSFHKIPLLPVVNQSIT